VRQEIAILLQEGRGIVTNTTCVVLDREIQAIGFMANVVVWSDVLLELFCNNIKTILVKLGLEIVLIYQ